jgi:hypothetical protein
VKSSDGIGRAMQEGSKASVQMRDPGSRHLQVTEDVRVRLAEFVVPQQPCFGKGAGFTEEVKIRGRAKLVVRSR